MIQLIDVSKTFRNNVVINNITMDFRDGELTVLIGPSGCGKTTMLKMINRLLPVSGGEILIDGQNIKAMDPVDLRRNMGYVIQQGGLFPHMTVRKNIEIIEELEGKDKCEIIKNTERLMKMVDMDPEEFLDRYPSELSGGQRQRVGVIRALANDPEYVLFDEPFSALDPLTRYALQNELAELHRKVGKTMIFVTHDMDEAIKVADRICIIKNGQIVQYDTPEVILRNPANEFVESFVGVNRIWDSPEYIKVEDFMIRDPVTCESDMTVEKCIIRMRTHRVDSLLVVAEEKRLIGIVDRNALSVSKDLQTKAREIMEMVSYVVNPQESIVDVLKMIEGSNVNNVPVVDSFGRLVGLLTSSSLVSTMSRKFIPDERVFDEEEGE